MTSREWQGWNGSLFTEVMGHPRVFAWEKAFAFAGRLACCVWGSAMVDRIMGVLDRWLPLE